jgi:hypothetical protein
MKWWPIYFTWKRWINLPGLKGSFFDHIGQASLIKLYKYCAGCGLYAAGGGERTFMEEKNLIKRDFVLLGYIGLCLVAFLTACFYPGITAETRGEIKDVMLWLGFPLGFAGGLAVKKSH